MMEVVTTTGAIIHAKLQSNRHHRQKHHKYEITIRVRGIRKAWGRPQGVLPP